MMKYEYSMACAYLRQVRDAERNDKSGYPMACAYLSRVRDAERHVERLRERAANLRMLLTDTSVHLTDMPHSNSPDPQKYEAIYAAIDELEREIKESEKKADDIRAEIGLTVCRLSDPLSQRALIYHYLQGMSWREAAAQMNFSQTQIYRFRDAGYAELEEMLKAA